MLFSFLKAALDWTILFSSGCSAGGEVRVAVVVDMVTCRFWTAKWLTELGFFDGSIYSAKTLGQQTQKGVRIASKISFTHLSPKAVGFSGFDAKGHDGPM